MTPFTAFILADGSLIGLAVCSQIWLFKTSSGGIRIKIAFAVALGVLACWSPLATRAILGYAQPLAMSELPDRFQLLAEHSVDDKSFDLWITVSEHPPLAVTIVPDKEMRSVLRQAQQKLGQGQPVIISRAPSKGEAGDGHGDALNGEKGNARPGSARTNFSDDQARWVLTIPGMPAKDGGDARQ